jgi:hypothetical protein
MFEAAFDPERTFLVRGGKVEQGYKGRVRNEAGCARLRSAGDNFAEIRRSSGTGLARERARASGCW